MAPKKMHSVVVQLIREGRNTDVVYLDLKGKRHLTFEQAWERDDSDVVVLRRFNPLTDEADISGYARLPMSDPVESLFAFSSPVAYMERPLLYPQSNTFVAVTLRGLAVAACGMGMKTIRYRGMHVLVAYGMDGIVHPEYQKKGLLPTVSTLAFGNFFCFPRMSYGIMTAKNTPSLKISLSNGYTYCQLDLFSWELTDMANTPAPGIPSTLEAAELFSEHPRTSDHDSVYYVNEEVLSTIAIPADVSILRLLEPRRAAAVLTACFGEHHEFFPINAEELTLSHCFLGTYVLHGCEECCHFDAVGCSYATVSLWDQNQISTLHSANGKRVDFNHLQVFGQAAHAPHGAGDGALEHTLLGALMYHLSIALSSVVDLLFTYVINSNDPLYVSFCGTKAMVERFPMQHKPYVLNPTDLFPFKDAEASEPLRVFHDPRDMGIFMMGPRSDCLTPDAIPRLPPPTLPMKAKY